MKNNFIARTITGAAFVSIIMAALTINYNVFSIIFLLIMIGNLYEFLKLVRKNNSLNIFCIITIITAVILYTFTYLINKQWFNSFHFFALIIPFVGIIIGIGKLRKKWLYAFLTFLTGLLYIGFPLIVSHRLVWESGSFNGTMLLLVFVLIWSYDTAAYIVGTKFGKHFIWKKISPLKSWEGAIGGTIITCVASYYLWNYLDFDNFHLGLGLTFTVISAATLGDFFESFLKRKVGVKDSGNILPGHGGLLDRFDSSLFAIPASVLYLWAVNFI